MHYVHSEIILQSNVDACHSDLCKHDNNDDPICTKHPRAITANLVSHALIGMNSLPLTNSFSLIAAVQST